MFFNSVTLDAQDQDQAEEEEEELAQAEFQRALIELQNRDGVTQEEIE